MKRFILSKSMLCLFLLGMACKAFGAQVETIELSLLSKFAGATWYNAEGSVATSGWTNKLVTNNTTPAITLQAPEGQNVMGWYTKTSGRWPALQAGHKYTITAPKGYGFTGYVLTTQATTSGNKDTFTYTTAEGQTESVQQNTSDSKITISGLNRISTITIDLTDYNVSSTSGIAISGLDVVLEAEFVKSEADFVNGGVYTFVTSRGWVGANDGDNAIGTVKTSVTPAPSTSNAMFQWTVYKSNNGNYYLYNIGKQKFLGAASNGVFPFVDAPDSKVLTFKNSSDANYPIMFSTDNTNAVSQNANSGLFAWSSGWNKLDDDGSNHKVMLVKTLTDAELEAIASIVEDYDKALAVQVAVEGWTANNPNTHFGNVTVTLGETVSTTKLTTKNMNVGYMMYNDIGDIITFTRPYRGFDFQGFYVGEESLGKSFELTEALKNSITDANPLIAKFTATSDVTLFYNDDPFSYRIPAIATTNTGRIIAVSDYRYSLDDIGRYNYGTENPGIDLVMRYSDDNGKTWSETKTIAKGSCVRGTDNCAYGDAAIAVVGEKVLVMGAAGDVMFGNGSATAHNRTVRIVSENNGETWSTPQDISETFFINADATINSAYSLFFGSGMLAVDQNYNNTGNARIYGAVLVKKEGTGNAIYVVYTDDFGLTWSVLGGSQTHIANNDEPKVEILPSGQILLSIRRQGGGGRQFNVFTYSDKATNAGSWNSNVNGCNNGGSNSTNGEIYLIDAKKADGSAVKLLLQSQPKGGSGMYDRRNVTIWYKEVTNANYTSSEIAGNWIEGMQVSNQLSAYSTMTLQKDGKIGFFFEEAPCYDDNYAKGYCMVYTPLTIESITKGNYFSPSTNLEEATTIDVTLTDAEGNTYKEQLTECKVGEVATKLQAKYPFITLGDNVTLTYDGTAYTYSNTLMLPFRVSNNETTIWHNIYFPSYNKPQYNPIYLSAESGNSTVKVCKENVAYGNSSFNTLEHNDEISWAIYQSGNGFTFTFKNKLVGKYIKVNNVSNSSNTIYEEEANATAFEIVPVPEKSGSYKAGYALKATVNDVVGYLSCTSSGNGYATHYSSNEHAGGRVNFAEVPNFETLIAEVNNVLSLIGTGLGKYTVTDANAETVEKAKDAMQNSNTVKLNDLITYRNLLAGANLNKPQNGQYFRVAYDYGGSVGKLYMQGVASTVKGVQFTAEDGDASVWVYYNGGLYSYYAGKYLREHGDDRGLQDTKTTVEFSESSRAKGKYNVKVGSFVHANSSNSNYFTDHCDKDGGHATHDLILEEAEVNLNCKIGEYKIGTFYANGAMKIPEGVAAYVATTEPEMDGNVGVITMTLIEDIIPAHTGVIVKSEPDTYTFKSVTTNEETVADNLMVGYAGPNDKEAVTLDGVHSYYILTVVDGNAGFYKKGFNFNVSNNKAYLKVPATTFASIRLRFNNNDGTTDIIEVPTEVLNMNGAIYDLSGRRVEKAEKGVYIVNGKKVIF